MAGLGFGKVRADAEFPCLPPRIDLRHLVQHVRLHTHVRPEQAHCLSVGLRDPKGHVLHHERGKFSRQEREAVPQRLYDDPQIMEVLRAAIRCQRPLQTVMDVVYNNKQFRATSP